MPSGILPPELKAVEELLRGNKILSIKETLPRPKTQSKISDRR